MAKRKKEQQKEGLKTAAIYCRVSTYSQGLGDYSSLDAQENKLREYCKFHGIDIYNVYRDTKTGSTLERDELNQLLEDAANGKFNLILVTKIDRLSRSIRDFQNLHDKLIDFGVDLVAVTQNIDMSTLSGRLMRDILIAFAEFERNMIAERTYEKLISQAEQGKWLGGLVNLGYDVVDKTLVMNEQEAKLVKIIYAKYFEIPSCADQRQLKLPTNDNYIYPPSRPIDLVV